MVHGANGTRLYWRNRKTDDLDVPGAGPRVGRAVVGGCGRRRRDRWLRLDGHNLIGLPLRTRKRLLLDALDFTDPLRPSAHRSTDGQRCLREEMLRSVQHVDHLEHPQTLCEKRSVGLYR